VKVGLHSAEWRTHATPVIATPHLVGQRARVDEVDDNKEVKKQQQVKVGSNKVAWKNSVAEARRQTEEAAARRMTASALATTSIPAWQVAGRRRRGVGPCTAPPSRC
jgi:hypothetical protein